MSFGLQERKFIGRSQRPVVYLSMNTELKLLISSGVGGHEKDTKSGISGSWSMGEPIIVAELKLFEWRKG